MSFFVMKLKVFFSFFNNFSSNMTNKAILFGVGLLITFKGFAEFMGLWTYIAGVDVKNYEEDYYLIGWKNGSLFEERRQDLFGWVKKMVENWGKIYIYIRGLVGSLRLIYGVEL